MLSKNKLSSIFAGVLLLTTSSYALADAKPITKSGSCPVGYIASSDWCVPSPNAKNSIEKNGNCPVGFVNSGNYCVGDGNVIHRNGNCPVGWTVSGNYCVQR